MPRLWKLTVRAPKHSPALSPLDVLTTQQVATWLQIHRRTVERMGLPRLTTGRYLRQHVIDHLERQQRLAS